MSDPKSNLDDALDEALDDKEPEKDVEEVEKSEEETAEEETEESESEEETEGDEESDVEEEEEEEETEEEAETKPTKEPSLVTKLKKDFPELAKKYPEVIDNQYLAIKFKEVFATVNAAEEAAEKADTMDGMLTGLSDGDMEPMMDLMYQRDPEGLKAVISNFLPSIQRKSPQMFKTIIRPVIGNFLASVAKRAQNSNDKDLLLATRIINRHISGDTGVPKEVETEVIKRERSAEEPDEVGMAEKVFYSAIDGIVDPALDTEIALGLDKDNAIPPKLRENINEEIKARIFAILKKNDSYMRTMSSMRKSARADGFNKAWQKKVARNVINHAKEIIPGIRSKVKKEMLGDMFKKSGAGDKDIPDSAVETNVSGGSSKGKAPTFDLKKDSIRDAMDKVLPS